MRASRTLRFDSGHAGSSHWAAFGLEGIVRAHNEASAINRRVASSAEQTAMGTSKGAGSVASREHRRPSTSSNAPWGNDQDSRERYGGDKVQASLQTTGSNPEMPMLTETRIERSVEILCVG